jgi:hypothetical protein
MALVPHEADDLMFDRIERRSNTVEIAEDHRQPLRRLIPRLRHRPRLFASSPNVDATGVFQSFYRSPSPDGW